MFFQLLAVVGTLSTQPAQSGRVCDGATTTQVNDCLSKRLSAAEDTLATYRVAAEKSVRASVEGSRADSLEAKAHADFSSAETAWKAYQNAECGAVFDRWSGGTVRTSMELVCRTRLTQLHAHTLWREWLTYVDSTPPQLPEPAVQAEP